MSDPKRAEPAMNELLNQSTGIGVIHRWFGSLVMR